MPFDYTLLNLPADVLRYGVSKFLSPSDKYRLVCGTRNRHLFSIFKTDVRYSQQQLKKLLRHVVRGEQAQAEAIIQQDPGLLLERGIVKDCADRLIEGTALQIALGAEDVRYHEEEICMGEMIQRYLSVAEIAKQSRQQFPEGWEVREEERKQRDLAELKKVFAHAIPNDDADPALNAFKNYLSAENKVVKTGKHFNMQLLIKALKLYDENADRFGDIEANQKNILWRKIIRIIEGYIPACYAQAILPGVWRIVLNGMKLRRRDIQLFYRSNPSLRSNYEYGLIDSLRAQFLETLCSRKNSRLKKMIPSQTRTVQACRIS